MTFETISSPPVSLEPTLAAQGWASHVRDFVTSRWVASWFATASTGGSRTYFGFRRRAFTATELLVVMVIVLVLSSLVGMAVSASRSSAKIGSTRALIAKLEGIIGTQFDSYAGRNPVVTPDKTRGDVLRDVVEKDLPDSWERVERLATDADDAATLEAMSPHQRAYVSVWKSIVNRGLTEQVTQSNGSAECLFMIIMQGGVSDCLDCRMSRIDVGDQDRDTMPEFLDAWGRPIGFMLWPRNLRLPASARTAFFSTKSPFDPVMPAPSEALGGLLRPLIYSAGPDGEAGKDPGKQPPVLLPHELDMGDAAAPWLPYASDNITNFDEDVR
jgi:prepilin-type N-terminal cleavage/methylation domain-containing protein